MMWIVGFCLVCSVVLFMMWVRKEMAQAAVHMKESFQSLSFEIMEKNSRLFLHLATDSLKEAQDKVKADLAQRQQAIDQALYPLKDVMQQLDAQYRMLESKREGAYAALSKQIELMVSSEKELRYEASKLAQALRVPHVTGSWGQLHLRRVIELAGLLNHCDFYEQKQFLEEEGKSFRPDVVVHLPDQRQIVVDAKAPLNAYIEASEASDEATRKRKLDLYAAVLRKHMKELSQKEYWKRLEMTPEYVILFLPSEVFFSAALQVDPALIEVGAEDNIIVATPSTLIAILRAVAFSWKQDRLSKNAEEIAKVGQELYERLGVVADHWNRVGRALGQTADAYNQAVASFEARLIPSARKMKDKGAAALGQELPEIKPLDVALRTKH